MALICSQHIAEHKGARASEKLKKIVAFFIRLQEIVRAEIKLLIVAKPPPNK
jgi:hypothetical protein